MSMASYWGQAYTADLASALSLEERISFPDVWGNWSGSDRTLRRHNAPPGITQTTQERCFRLKIACAGYPR